MSALGNAVVPVLLSGGSGTRLWPVSRESFPKQFWPLVSDRSMIAETLSRARGPGFAAPVVVCNARHRFLVAEEMRREGIEGARIVLEPVGRNSAPAIGVAALLAAEQDPDAVLWMMAADAAIADVPALHAALAEAVAAARAGRIVTFGMQPTAPETGYGYIERGAALPGLPGVFDLARFVEKPDAARAAEMLAGGRHLWNSGMFVFTARTLLAEMAAHAPNVLAALRPVVATRTEDADFVRLDADLFAKVPSISLDYAVAERTHHAAVVPAALGWSDVGSWAALWELGKPDAAGNVAAGDVILEGAHDCYVRSEGRLAAAVGVRDLVLVVTDDAVLAMSRASSQDVKKVVDRLKSAGRPEGTRHCRAATAWGSLETLPGTGADSVRLARLAPAAALAAEETLAAAQWTLLAGTVTLEQEGARRALRCRETVRPGPAARLVNTGTDEAVLLALPLPG